MNVPEGYCHRCGEHPCAEGSDWCRDCIRFVKRRELKARNEAILRLARLKSIFGTPQWSWEHIGRTYGIGPGQARRVATRLANSPGRRRLKFRRGKRAMI